MRLPSFHPERSKGYNVNGRTMNKSAFSLCTKIALVIEVMQPVTNPSNYKSDYTIVGFFCLGGRVSIESVSRAGRSWNPNLAGSNLSRVKPTTLKLKLVTS